MKVGLVLGAGGVLGGAWLTGGLNAIARETGWDPGSADFIVGTSAGSMVGALLAAGVPPWFMVAHSRGESFSGLTGPDGQPASEADRAGGAAFRLHRGLPVLGPGSLRMAVSALTNPLRRPPLQLVAGWVPVGLISTDALKDTVRRAAPGPLGGPPELLGRDLRLPHRQAHPLRAHRLAAGRGGRRRGSVLRHPRLLPAGEDRRPPLRGRRRVLGLEPRPARAGAASIS